MGGQGGDTGLSHKPEVGGRCQARMAGHVAIYSDGWGWGEMHAPLPMCSEGISEGRKALWTRPLGWAPHACSVPGLLSAALGRPRTSSEKAASYWQHVGQSPAGARCSVPVLQ